VKITHTYIRFQAQFNVYADDDKTANKTYAYRFKVIYGIRCHHMLLKIGDYGLFLSYLVDISTVEFTGIYF